MSTIDPPPTHASREAAAPSDPAVGKPVPPHGPVGMQPSDVRPQVRLPALLRGLTFGLPLALLLWALVLWLAS